MLNNIFLNSHFLLYLDPGTGSLLVQSIIAVVLGVSFFFGRIKKKIVSIFKSSKNNSDEEGI